MSKILIENKSVFLPWLSTFAAERRRLQLKAPSAPAAIDRYLLPIDRAAANTPAAVAAADRWTDRRTD